MDVDPGVSVGVDATDESNAILAAFDEAQSCGATLAFPPGHWSLEAPLVFDEGAMTVRGRGPRSIIHSDGPAFSSVAGVIEDVEIRGLSIEGRSPGSTEFGIDFDGVERVAIRGVAVTGFENGIRVHWSRDLEVEDVMLEGGGLASGTGIELQGTSHGHFNPVIRGGLVAEFGVGVDAGKTYGLRIENNRILDSGVGLDLSSAFTVDTEIENNWIRGWATGGLRAVPPTAPGSSNLHVAGNIIDQAAFDNTCLAPLPAFDSCSAAVRIGEGVRQPLLELNHFEELSGAFAMEIASHSARVHHNTVTSIAPTAAPAAVYQLRRGLELRGNEFRGSYTLEPVLYWEGAPHGDSIPASALRIDQHPNPPGTPLAIPMNRIPEVTLGGVVRSILDVDFETDSMLNVDRYRHTIRAHWDALPQRTSVWGIKFEEQFNPTVYHPVGREITIQFTDCNARLMGTLASGQTISPFRLQESGTSAEYWDPGPYDSITFVLSEVVSDSEPNPAPSYVWVETARTDTAVACG